MFKALEDQDLFPSYTIKFLCSPFLSQHKTVQITACVAVFLWLPVPKRLLSKISSHTQDSQSLFANAQHGTSPHGPVVRTNTLETIWCLWSISLDTKRVFSQRSMFRLFLDPNTKLQKQIFQAKILKHFANASNQTKVSFHRSSDELFAGCCSAGQKWVLLLPQDDKQQCAVQ